MSRYEVDMIISYKKTLTIYANDESSAEDKAEALVNSWENVHDCEVMSVNEV